MARARLGARRANVADTGCAGVREGPWTLLYERAAITRVRARGDLRAGDSAREGEEWPREAHPPFPPPCGHSWRTGGERTIQSGAPGREGGERLSSPLPLPAVTIRGARGAINECARRVNLAGDTPTS